jgi:plastocyanin
MPDFSIIIVSSGGTTGFKPDMPDAEVGQPLGAPQFSVVTWDNETGDSHQIAITEETSIDGTRVTVDGYLSSVILPGMSSRENYSVAAPEGTSIPYFCNMHSGESGTIFVQGVNLNMPTVEENS